MFEPGVVEDAGESGDKEESGDGFGEAVKDEVDGAEVHGDEPGNAEDDVEGVAFESAGVLARPYRAIEVLS